MIKIKFLDSRKSSKPSPYIEIIHRSIVKEKEIQLEEYNPRKSIYENIVNSDSDIYHIHWPEFFLKYRDMDFTEKIEYPFKLIYILILFIFKKFYGKKIFTQIHNFKPHEDRPISYYFFLKLLYLISNKLIVMSFQQKNEYNSLYFFGRKKVEVIYHPNYVEFYNNSTNTIEARKKLKLPRDNFIYGYFGSIRPYKGIEKLFESFNRLNSEDLLLVCGKWSRELNKEKIIRKYKNPRMIIVDERIPSKKIQYYLNSMDVLVFPFKEITNSGSSLLALSFYKPVIIPFKSSLKELSDEKKPFSLFFNNESELLDCMLKIKTVNLDEYSKNAKNFIKIYDIKDISKKLIEIYQE